MAGDECGQGRRTGWVLDEERLERYRSKMLRDAKEMLRNAPPSVAEMPSETRTVKWTFALGALKSRCLAGGDPELKSK
ncbi:MAG: hypothetical protein ACREQR_11295 [Candidatus Binataceae bacterium]